METNFGGEGIWLFALLILFGMGGFGGFGNNASRTASVEDLNTTSNFTRLENQVRANADLTERKTDAISNGICSLGYELQGQINNSNTTILNAINNLSSKIDADKIASLQAQVSDLKTQNYFNNVPRINPYAYGVYPYATNCGCNNI